MDKKDILIVAIVAIVASLAVSAFAPQIGFGPPGGFGSSSLKNAHACIADYSCEMKQLRAGNQVNIGDPEGATRSLLTRGGGWLLEVIIGKTGVPSIWLVSTDAKDDEGDPYTIIYQSRGGVGVGEGAIGVSDGKVCAGDTCLNSEAGQTYDIAAGEISDSTYESMTLGGKTCFLTTEKYTGIIEFSSTQFADIGCRVYNGDEGTILSAAAKGLDSGSVLCEARCLDDGTDNLRDSDYITFTTQSW